MVFHLIYKDIYVGNICKRKTAAGYAHPPLVCTFYYLYGMSKTPNRERLHRAINQTDGISTFGSPDDRRRLLWVVLTSLHETSSEGADWNDVLDEAEKRGIDRTWAHEEIIRRLRWGDVHLFEGNLYPHHRRQDSPDLLCYVMQSGEELTALSEVDTRLNERMALEKSLWRIIAQNSGRQGVRVRTVTATAEQYEMDWIWAWEMMKFWISRGDLEKASSGDRIVSVRDRWKP